MVEEQEIHGLLDGGHVDFLVVVVLQENPVVLVDQQAAGLVEDHPDHALYSQLRQSCRLQSADDAFQLLLNGIQLDIESLVKLFCLQESPHLVRFYETRADIISLVRFAGIFGKGVQLPSKGSEISLGQVHYHCHSSAAKSLALYQAGAGNFLRNVVGVPDVLIAEGCFPVAVVGRELIDGHFDKVLRIFLIFSNFPIELLQIYEILPPVFAAVLVQSFIFFPKQLTYGIPDGAPIRSI